MHFNDREEIIALTPQWKGDRMEDGRPYVPDKYLRELKKMTLEDLYDFYSEDISRKIKSTLITKRQMCKKYTLKNTKQI